MDDTGAVGHRSHFRIRPFEGGFVTINAGTIDFEETIKWLLGQRCQAATTYQLLAPEGSGWEDASAPSMGSGYALYIDSFHMA